MSLITYIRWQNDYSAVFFEECSRYQEAQIRWNMHSKGECQDGALEGSFLVISVVLSHKTSLSWNWSLPENVVHPQNVGNLEFRRFTTN